MQNYNKITINPIRSYGRQEIKIVKKIELVHPTNCTYITSLYYSNKTKFVLQKKATLLELVAKNTLILLYHKNNVDCLNVKKVVYFIIITNTIFS